jgi:hypothetical protein
MFGWLGRALDALKRLVEPKVDFEPELEPGEVIIARDIGARIKGQFGARWRPMVLTSRRLILHDSEILLFSLAHSMSGSKMSFVRTRALGWTGFLVAKVCGSGWQAAKIT